jgi:hypothetical protein
MTAVMKPETESTAAALDRIGQLFQVPAYVGAPVLVDGRPGRVSGADGDDVMVLFHGADDAEQCHPRWGIIWREQDGPAGVVPIPLIKPAPALLTWVDGEAQWSGV